MSGYNNGYRGPDYVNIWFGGKIFFLVVRVTGVIMAVVGSIVCLFLGLFSPALETAGIWFLILGVPAIAMLLLLAAIIRLLRGSAKPAPPPVAPRATTDGAPWRTRVEPEFRIKRG
jgi:ABC-type dipeptide/oligopeptide/nickel transport system permease subunit